MRTTSATGDRGFTLIELVLVVVVLALVAAVAAPSFTAAFRSLELNETVRSFAMTCQLARVQAITRQQPATLHISVESQQFWLTQPDTNTDTEVQDNLVKRVAISPRVSLVSWERNETLLVTTNTDANAGIQFLPNGTCEGGTAVFQGRDKSDGLAAIIDPVTGKVTIQPVSL